MDTDTLVLSVILGTICCIIAAVTGVITCFGIGLICSHIYEKINAEFRRAIGSVEIETEPTESTNLHRAAVSALSNTGKQQRE